MYHFNKVKWTKNGRFGYTARNGHVRVIMNGEHPSKHYTNFSKFMLYEYNDNYYRTDCPFGRVRHVLTTLRNSIVYGLKDADFIFNIHNYSHGSDRFTMTVLVKPDGVEHTFMDGWPSGDKTKSLDDNVRDVIVRMKKEWREKNEKYIDKEYMDDLNEIISIFEQDNAIEIITEGEND